jgi:UDP-N-acetylmuramoyl-L-alanyl-D-glutamate--2,6-diaminopimelate ligase
LRDAGADCAAIEVSSHALDQDRVAGISFDTVVFTNLSRDHLDYHGNMRRYAEAKARLFTNYPARHRIVNLDSEFAVDIATRCGQNVVTVSTTFDRVANGRPYVFARSIVVGQQGSRVGFSSSWGDGEFTVPIPGDFNVANAVTVLACLLVRGVPLVDACRVLAAVEAPPGRMQRVAGDDGQPAVYVDYAHTPDALRVVLSALSAHCRGQLWCVFGCGGERDAGKRPQMGQVAERRADRVVVTSDNPRGEPPDQIIRAVLEGMSKAGKAVAIEDRATAIAWTIASARPQDCVLIAGKGHEDYQLIGNERRDFSDYEAARAALKARTGGDR